MSDLNYKLNLIKDARDDIQTALAEKGQVVGKDIRDYAQAVSQITTSEDLEAELSAQEQLITQLEEAINSKTAYKEGAKIFETVEEMQADPSPSENDLAVVYNPIKTIPLSRNGKFNKIYIPNDTVVLDEQYTGEQTESHYQAIDGKTGELEFYLGSRDFTIRYMASEGSIDVTYSSSDGITYVRQYDDFDDKVIEFNSIMRQVDNYNWDDEHIEKMGKFIKYDEQIFNGLYKYETDWDIIEFTSNNNEKYYFPNITTMYDESSNSNYINIPRDYIIFKIINADENNRILSAIMWSTQRTNEYIEKNIQRSLFLKDGYLVDSDTGEYSTYKYTISIDWSKNKIIFTDYSHDKIPFNESENWVASGKVYTDSNRNTILLPKSSFPEQYVQIK